MSTFPIRWHEDLTDEADVREHVRFIRSDASGYRGTDGSLHAAGVPKSLLRATLAVLGGQHSYTAADQQIYDLKQQGEVAVYPDQHPNADVQLRE